jgi:multiple RNA-binding domain-containing protein 1
MKTQLISEGPGLPTRVAMWWRRTVALVEFGGAADARRAFKKLAYTRYQHVPLYLEWAPLGIFTEEGRKVRN